MSHAHGRVTILFATMGLFCSGGSAQQSTASDTRSFEVVAIKPNNSGDRRTGFLPLSGDHFIANNVTVRQLIQFAYKLQDFQIIAALPGQRTSDLMLKPKSRSTHQQMTFRI